METFAFRLVVRGTNKAGVRVRRCRVQHSPSYEQAWQDFAERYTEMVKGLSNPSYSVLPPAGFCMDGSISAGFETA